jgi:hypothetical protein
MAESFCMPVPLVLTQEPVGKNKNTAATIALDYVRLSAQRPALQYPSDGQLLVGLVVATVPTGTLKGLSRSMQQCVDAHWVFC